MGPLGPDGQSDSNSKPNPADFLRQLRKTGQRAVLTINGKSELVVEDPTSYQKLIEVADRAGEMESLRVAVEEMRAGQGTPIEEMFAEMERILAEKKAL